MAQRHRDTFNEINITPLTDIFLVLLIIMMVVAPLLDQQGLNLTVPDNVQAEQIKESKVLTVMVSNDGKYFVADQEVPKSNLTTVIQERSKELPDGVLIQTEPDAIHGDVVAVMDAARNVGVLNISIAELN